jgi:hypothetical protein
MDNELQQFKEQLGTVTLRYNDISELIELKIKEGRSLYNRQQMLKIKIAEME